MAINHFSELRGLHGTLSEAATTSLVRYFAILKVVKKSLRQRFSGEDLKDIADVVLREYRDGRVGSDAHAIINGVATQVSKACAAKIHAMSFVASMAFVDAIRRRLGGVPGQLADGTATSSAPLYHR